MLLGISNCIKLSLFLVYSFLIELILLIKDLNLSCKNLPSTSLFLSFFMVFLIFVRGFKQVIIDPSILYEWY